MTLSLEQVKEGIQVLNAAGLLGMLVYLMWSGFKEKWVYGWLYKKMEQRAQAAESINERAILVAHKILVDAEQEDHR